MIDLNQNIMYIKGVGPERVKLLNKLNIHTLYDLITYYPKDYEDRTIPKNIAELINEEESLIEGIVISRLSEVRLSSKITVCKLTIRDETGLCIITWFNNNYLKNIFNIGEKYRFFGKIKIGFGKIEMLSPVFDKEGSNKNTGKIVPIYALTYALSR